jgi:hypothetical protein
MLSCPGEDPLCNGCAQADRPLGFTAKPLWQIPNRRWGYGIDNLIGGSACQEQRPRPPRGSFPVQIGGGCSRLS